MLRKPVVANKFYAGNLQDLEIQIRRSFFNELGPGNLPSNRSKNVKGAVVPHAGFMYSGACAAWAYKEIGESELPDLYIIIGPNHTGLGTTSTIREDWQTPFGIVKSDLEFIEKISKSILLEPIAHIHEHSIEVQLPYLQFVNKNQIHKIRIAPICIAHDANVFDVAASIRKSIGNKKAMIIASSDFTHYGVNYGFMPFVDKVKENLYTLDKGAIDLILKLDTQGFLDYCDANGLTICGKKPIAILMELLKDSQPKLLKYYTSGDVSEDYSNAVGYGAIVFE